MAPSLWKYYTKEQTQDFLLSLHLTENLTHTPTAEMALLYALANHADEHYEKISIPKRNGTKRILHAPDSVLKYVQTQILRQVLREFLVSGYACAYQKGISLRSNAFPHQAQKLVLKLDIQDFFDSISYISVYQHGFPCERIPDSVRTLLAHLCCYKDRLPQGAPTSPYLSNLVMKPFDEYMGNWCRVREIAYTRYCDDMTFSGDFHPKEVLKKAEGFLNRLGFELNHKKTRICSQKNRQEITGIVANEKLQVPKNYRRRLRQECYYIRKFGLENHLSHIEYTGDKQKYLQRLLCKIQYVLQINPEDGEFCEWKRWITNSFFIHD